MSFQEFAENLFGDRKSVKEKNKNELKRANRVFEDEKMLKQNAKESEEFEEEQIISGSIPGWLADKKLPKTTKKKSTVKKNGEERTALTGVKEHETDDAVLLNVKKQGPSSKSTGQFAKEKWIPKSQFEEFQVSDPLNERQEEKAERIMESRSKRAQRTDRRNAAPIADSFEEWKDDPSETDLPGIDTIGSGDTLDDIL